MCACVHASVHEGVLACVGVWVPGCVRACMHMSACVRACMSACMRAFICACQHEHIHTLHVARGEPIGCRILHSVTKACNKVANSQNFSLLTTDS